MKDFLGKEKSSKSEDSSRTSTNDETTQLSSRGRIFSKFMGSGNSSSNSRSSSIASGISVNSSRSSHVSTSNSTNLKTSGESTEGTSLTATNSDIVIPMPGASSESRYKCIDAHNKPQTGIEPSNQKLNSPSAESGCKYDSGNGENSNVGVCKAGDAIYVPNVIIPDTVTGSSLPVNSDDPQTAPNRPAADPLWSILPSYYMYTNTVNRKFEQTSSPPDYTVPSRMSSESSISLSAFEASLPIENSTSSSVILADENSHDWQETIIDNISSLKNLTNTDNAVSNAVKISTHFTKEIGEVGKPGEEIDPSLYEYKAGDYINGYVYITNESKEDIPFEMFYLLFEGNFVVNVKPTAEDTNPMKTTKFLEMFDFSASWNEVNVDRLITEFRSPLVCPKTIDPRDNSHIFFFNKTIRPGVLYKRFFTFKIPNSLLDSECNEHNLVTHVQLPPTLGMSKREATQREEESNKQDKDVASNKHASEKGTKTSQQAVPVKDLSIVNSAINYRVMARFVGKNSHYNAENTPAGTKKLVNSAGDEYNILKEKVNYMRIVQRSPVLSASEAVLRNTEKKVLYKNLLQRIKEKIDWGEQMTKVLESQNDESALELFKKAEELELIDKKSRQRYRANKNVSGDTKSPAPETIIPPYTVYTPINKKGLTSTKPMGTLQVSTPRKTYQLTYIPPTQFRDSPPAKSVTDTWKIKLDLDLSFTIPTLSKTKTLPQVKKIVPELVATTIKSPYFPIPIEFDHDFVFNQPPSDNTPPSYLADKDTLTNNIVIPMKTHATKLYHLMKSLGDENFKLERQLIEDIKSLCQIEEKFNLMTIKDYSVNGLAKKTPLPKDLLWTHDEKSNSYSQKISIELDLTSAELKQILVDKSNLLAYDKFCLVPNFQSCYMARMYFIRICLVLGGNETVFVKVPVEINKY
jgi:hypothetical protein